MNKDFKDFRNIIKAEELLAAIFDKTHKTPVEIEIPEDEENLATIIKLVHADAVRTSISAAVDILSIYHQWLNDPEDA